VLRDVSVSQLLDVASGTGRFVSFVLDNYPTLDTTVLDLSPFYLAGDPYPSLSLSLPCRALLLDYPSLDTTVLDLSPFYLAGDPLSVPPLLSPSLFSHNRLLSRRASVPPIPPITIVHKPSPVCTPPTPEAQKLLRRFAPANPNIRFVEAAVEGLPFPDASFDAITCVYLFHELPAEIRLQV
jgi:Methyltransferase domain